MVSLGVNGLPGVNGLAVGLECRQGAASAYNVLTCFRTGASGQTLLNFWRLETASQFE